jgi:hypothetical protein
MTKYLMYQGIPIDGDTPQPMFEAKWDVAPIKVVAQADYDAVAAELRIQALEAVLRDLLDDMGEDTNQRHHRDKYRAYQVSPQTVDAARKTLLFPAETPSSDREPPHCPSCSCGLTAKAVRDRGAE